VLACQPIGESHLQTQRANFAAIMVQAHGKPLDLTHALDRVQFASRLDQPRETRSQQDCNRSERCHEAKRRMKQVEDKKK
jgi:hypothetical protein